MKVTYLQHYSTPDREGEVVEFRDVQPGEYAVLDRDDYSYIYYIGDDGYEYEYYITEDRWTRLRENHLSSKDTSKMRIVSTEFIQAKYNTQCPWR